MSPASAIVPWLLTAHLAALAISAIPSPEAIRAARGTRESADDAASRIVRPVLDNAAVGLVAVSDMAWRITSPVRPIVRLYVNTLGLGQTWSMFASPPRGSQFLRFRHFVKDRTAPAGAPEKVISEIVFPAAPYGTFRGLGAYWQSHGDKATSNAIEAYYQERARRRTAGLPEPREGDAALDAALARSFVPLVQYYHRRFAASLPAGDVLVRSETWSGWADSPHRGERRIAEAQRATALAPFAAGPVADVSEIRRHTIDTEAIEADIRWTLLYVQDGGSSD
jgi:hypothetical protein